MDGSLRFVGFKGSLREMFAKCFWSGRWTSSFYIRRGGGSFRLHVHVYFVSPRRTKACSPEGVAYYHTFKNLDMSGGVYI